MKSTCCSAPVEEECICSEWDGKGRSVCGFPCPECDKKIELEKQNRMIDNWNKLQEENEDALHSPPIDVGSVCIALGWGLLWMGAGILIGILILI